MKRLAWLAALLAGLWTGLASADIQVQALFEGSAYLKIDGQQKLLREGQSFNNLTLISANPRRALVDWNGERQELTLSSRISAKFKQNQSKEVTLHRSKDLKYVTTIQVNGRQITALLDTGANLMAMSATHAKLLGLNYRKGDKAMVSTASGRAPAYRVNLGSVSVGGIVARHVPAVVIEGNYPADVLLGMSYLEHVDMQEKNNILTLRARY